MSMDERPPTTVGPKSEEAFPSTQNLPRGIEKVVALARLSSCWRERVLEDPLAAADAAGLELTESERAILSSVPRTVLGGMAGSFDRALPRSVVWGGVAAGVAAAAAVGGAAALPAGHEQQRGASEPGVASEAPVADGGAVTPAMLGLPAVLSATWVCLIGSTADIPVSVERSTPIKWAGSIPDALDEAEIEPKCVRCVFLPNTSAGKTPDRLQLADEDLRDAANKAGVWNVNVYKPLASQEGDSEARRRQLEKTAAEYKACIRKYGIRKFPTVVYLSPKGVELARLEDPSAADEIRALKALEKH